MTVSALGIEALLKLSRPLCLEATAESPTLFLLRDDTGAGERPN